jgi:hypothetical protein
MPKRAPASKRYSAALLFQYRVMVGGSPGKRRLGETRIIHFRSFDGPSALSHAKQRGKAAEHNYKKNEGNRVFFEFVGVRDLLCCDPACEADEDWYQTVELLTPMERKSRLIPPESELCASRNSE